MRVARPGARPPSPRQKSRTVSRYCPFHSLHPAGNCPDVVAASDIPRLGDQLHLARALGPGRSPRGTAVRVEVALRRGRAPPPDRSGTRRRASPPPSSAAQSIPAGAAAGWCRSTVLPHPVSSTYRARFIREPVVRGVVHPAEAQRRSRLAPSAVWLNTTSRITWRPAACRPRTIRAELLDLAAAVTARAVVVVGREVPDRLIAPVVAEPARGQEPVVDELMHGQQFDGGHAEPGGGRSRPGGPARRRCRAVPGHLRMDRVTLDVQLVDHRVGQRVSAAARRSSRTRRHNDRARHVRTPSQVVVSSPLERRRSPHRAGDRPGVGIEQQLGRVAARARRRVIRSVDPEAVALPG